MRVHRVALGEERITVKDEYANGTEWFAIDARTSEHPQGPGALRIAGACLCYQQVAEFRDHLDAWLKTYSLRVDEAAGFGPARQSGSEGDV